MSLALVLLAVAATDTPPPLTPAQKEAIVVARKAAEVKAAPVALRFAAAVKAVTDNMLADAPDPMRRQKLADEMRAALGEVMAAKGQQTWETCHLLTVEQRKWVRAAMAKPGAPGDPWEVIEKAYKEETSQPEAVPAKKPTADDVVGLWSPELPGAKEFGRIGGTPKDSPSVAGYTFRVKGVPVERLWNHYADFCGVSDRYGEKRFLNTANAGPKGSYVVSDRADGSGGRGPSLFLLKTDGYKVTVTFQPDAGGKSVSGSITAVVP